MYALSLSLLEYGEMELVRELVTLLSKIWNEAITASILKKGNQKECGKILTVTPKLLTFILIRKLSAIREKQAREEQTGCFPGCGCIEQIYALRQLLEHRHTHRMPNITAFLVAGAVLDSINMSTLWNGLLKYDVLDNYIRILKSSYTQ